MMGGIVMSQGGAAQITTPFWLPDSHAYAPEAVGDAQVQASAAIQSMSEYGQILEVGAALGEDPRTAARGWSTGRDGCRPRALRRRVSRHRRVRARVESETGGKRDAEIV